ncbi:hypothetical protein HDU97_009862 [Phlyctochytrium planicorne]|nr:hypothetical protein HDU97_009862 [Phlyctochytrium planicorne]
MSKFTNVVLVTGGARGIGAATAIEIAAPNTAIAITYNSSKAQADETLAKIKAKGAQGIAIQANLSTPQGAKKVVTETVEAFGPITALINNAGVYDAIPIDQVTEDHYIRVFDNNVKTAILVTSAAVPNLKDGASITTISSVVSHTPFGTNTVYAASKGALEAFTRALAVELAPRKIRVNAVSPGFTSTDMLPGAYHDFAKGLTPFGRVGTAEEVADVIAFYATGKSGWVTGQNVNVSGGIAYAL